MTKKPTAKEKEQEILRDAKDMARAHERVLAYGLAGILRDCDRSSKAIHETFAMWSRAEKKADELVTAYWASYSQSQRSGRVRRHRQVKRKAVAK